MDGGGRESRVQVFPGRFASKVEALNVSRGHGSTGFLLDGLYFKFP